MINAAAVKFNVILKLEKKSLNFLWLAIHHRVIIYTMVLIFFSKNKRFRFTHHSWIEEYKQFCAGYEQIRSMYITLREELQHEESEVLS